MDRELLSEYLNGEIVLTSDTGAKSPVVVRGKLLEVTTLNDEWLSAKLTCDAYATSHDKEWHASTGGVTHVLLHSVFDRTEDGTLAFTRQTPQGTTARVSPPALKAVQHAA
jgi:hypothetical protein